MLFLSLPGAFNTALLCTALYVALLGGRAGKYGAAFALAAAVITYVGVGETEAYYSFNPIIFLGDSLLLVGFVGLSICSNRWWPIWAAAMQVNGVSAHIVAACSSAVVRDVYYGMATFWGVPILFTMAVGTMMDRRAAARGRFQERFERPR